MALEDLAARFKRHEDSSEASMKMNSLRESFISLADRIDIYCSNSRETSLALTKLEEALFWCNADLDRNSHG